MATISTPQYLLDQARRRFTPTMNTIPGMGAVDKRLREREWPQYLMADPPPGSGLRPVMGDAGLPVVGPHDRDVPQRSGLSGWRRTASTARCMLRKTHRASPPSPRWDPTPPRRCSPTRTRTSARRAGQPVIGPFFTGGLMLIDFEEHMYPPPDHAGGLHPQPTVRIRRAHRPGRLAGRRQRLGHQRSPLPVLPGDQGTDTRHRLGGVHGSPARQRPRTGHQDEQGIHRHHPRRRRDHPHRVPPFKWWRGLQGPRGARELLHRAGQGAPRRQAAPTCSRVLCQTRTRTATGSPTTTSSTT